jgi:hypothetical protein
VAGGRGFSEVGGGLGTAIPQKKTREMTRTEFCLQSSVWQIGSLIEAKAVSDSGLS